jgi:tetratricopeptide (TPR) repeat protein
MKLITRILISLLTIFSTTMYYKVILFDYEVSKVVRFNDVTDSTVSKVFGMSTYYIPNEKVFVKFYQSKNIDQHDCNLLLNYSNTLLKSNSRSTQAYFVKSVCDEKNGDLNGALNNALMALKFNKFNTTSLLTIAILQFNLGNINRAQDYVDMIEKIDPKTKNLEIIKNAIITRK